MQISGKPSDALIEEEILSKFTFLIPEGKFPIQISVVQNTIVVTLGLLSIEQLTLLTPLTIVSTKGTLVTETGDVEIYYMGSIHKTGTISFLLDTFNNEVKIISVTIDIPEVTYTFNNN